MGTSRSLVMGTYSTYLGQLGNFPGLLISSRLPPPPTTLEYNAECLHLEPSNPSSVNQLTHQRLLTCGSHRS
ncbi:hypothetical protein CPAR01_05118 [Colletotrichum paranaense]|uniref:Uncharacterized protein n=1 Tax=Colletotrichum paranaense TaxID=1914294 RepID=A0ABQ9SRW4_9PEZI|nr:uncharacterized protein CPAR01_05118 [Colletotrichum paranaense]KAK1541731.1 hypothetical protein CPAR01_05118 [Colletotrichum paranaense]